MMISIDMFGMAACRGSATTPILSFPAILPLRGCILAETRNLNNPDLPSPYPAGAQLFFRAVTAIHESTFALKVAFVVCDFAIVFVLLDVLRCSRQGAHLVLAFAWNPLLAIEVAGSGHIDIVGALLLLVSAAALVRRWRATAAVALGLAIAVKLLPVVLLPLYWKRVRIRDAALAAAVVGLLYVPFLNHGRIPIGSLGTYVQSFRFNGPVFAALDQVAPPQLLAGLAVLVGLVTATWLRRAAPEWSPDAICLAHGSISFVRTRRIPMVSSLAAAISDVGLDAADHHLDREHYPHLRPMALARTWASVGGASWLGNAAGIRMRGNRCRDYRFAPEPHVARAPMLNGVGSVKTVRPNKHYCIRKPGTVILHSIRSIHRGANSMTNARRFTMMGLLLCGVLVLAPNFLGADSARQFSNRSPKPMASIRGTKSRRSAIPGTGKLPDSSKLLTRGSGSPRPTRSTFEGKDKDGKPVKVTYVRSDPSSQTDAVKNEIDPSFINDNYWTPVPLPCLLGQQRHRDRSGHV